MRRFREAYGASPLHLIAVLGSFAVAAYALSRALELTANPDRILIWLGGSIVAHDLVLFPLYALVGIVAAGLVLGRAREPSSLRVAALNHVRFPALTSALLLLVWFPLVAAKGERTYMRASGLSKDVYLGRWLLVSGALFAGSAIVFVLRAGYRARRRGRPA